MIFLNINSRKKSWGWIGVTALLYSQIALENYLGAEKVKPEFKPALKAILWQYLNVVANKKLGKDDRHE